MTLLPAQMAFCLLVFMATLAFASAFVPSPICSRLHHHDAAAASPRASHRSRTSPFSGLLRMAQEGMDGAEAAAKKLKDQAEALRKEAAADEAQLRPLKEERADAPAKPQRDIRPEDLPPKIDLSDTMKSKLRQELISQGADPNRTVGNPILVVSAIIAVLVVIGGKGIFY